MPSNHTFEILKWVLLINACENQITAIGMADVSESSAYQLFLDRFAVLGEEVILCSNDGKRNHRYVHLIFVLLSRCSFPILSCLFVDLLELLRFLCFKLFKTSIAILAYLTKPE
jgi:hypothetical protein